MSMFSFFRRSTNNSQPEVQSPKEQVIPDVDSDDGKESFDSIVEVSGGKGWPTNATVLLYHKKQGLICVGTDGGSIYVYGDGFQYMRPWLTEQANEVVSIVGLHPNRILVTFGDNSIVVMELPTLEVIDLLQAGSWMNPRWGDITAVHCDLPSEKNFIYVGTSEGYLTVLDVMESAIRVCDFELNLSDFGLNGQSFSITDLQSCPKDERYLAVSFDGSKETSGAVVIYDLVKHKLVKVFNTAGISAIHWHHFGEVLYAGTRGGDVLYINPDKGVCNPCWNAAEEKLEDEDNSNNVLYIRRIAWLAPQSDGSEGCLFVLIGLHPESSSMSVIFALPPISCEKIINFRVVPTYNKNLKANNAQVDDLEKTPGLLLLVQKQTNISLGQVERGLYIMRCPTTEIKDWALEMGTLPDPRKAREVQPASADITVTNGFVPNFKNPLSLGKALLTSIVEDEQVVSTAVTQKAPAVPSVEDVFAEDQTQNKRMSRRLSARLFFENQLNLSDLEVQLEVADWEMVLVPGEHEESTEGLLRQQDIVFNGHADGTIIAYGVSMPDNRKEFGKASIWLPLTALRCGTTSVTVISFDESAGLLFSGDEEGCIVIHEVYDKQTSIGAIDLLKKINDQTFSEAEEFANDNENNGSDIHSIEEFSSEKFLKDASLYDYNHFNSIREVYRTKLSEQITSLLTLGPFLMLFVGTSEGSVFFTSDLKSPSFAKIEKLETIGAHGAVKGFDFSYYLHKGNLLCCVYAFFESGHIVVIDIHSMTIVAFTVAFAASKVATGAENKTIHTLQILPVVNAAFNLLPKPTLLSYAYMAARIKSYQRTARLFSSGSFDSTTSDISAIPRPQSSILQAQASFTDKTNQTVQKRSFFGSMRASKESAPTSPTAVSTSSGVRGVSPVPSMDKPVDSPDYSKIRLIEFSEIQAPKYLVFISGNSISTVALSKFLAPGPKPSMHNAAAALGGVHTKELCKQSILASQIYYLPDKRQDEPDSPRKGESLPRNAYLACVDDEGLVRVVSFKSRSAIHHANPLESVISIQSMEDQDEDIPRPLFTATLLPNGSCYLVGRGIMQYSATIIFVDEDIPSNGGNLLGNSFPFPERAIPTSKELDKNLALLHGREQILQNLKAQLKKRRSSVITLSAAPTDLYKIFHKTREQRTKAELFGKEDPSSDTESVNSNTQKSKQSAVKVKNELDQLKENFAERGEKINRIAMKMDDFKLQASNYQKLAKEHKEKLQKRNTRWGLF